MANVAIGRWATGDWDTVLELVGSESLDTGFDAIVSAVVAMISAAQGRDPHELVDATPEVEETVCSTWTSPARWPWRSSVTLARWR
ncbi:MAG TPA: hypothetical protein VFI21_14500 [Nocardioides sp.]|nr:hypothetical protein [Nocardioides sp.]